MSNRRPPRTKFGAPPAPMRPTPNPVAARPPGARLHVKPPPKALPLAATIGRPPRNVPKARQALGAPAAPTRAAGDPMMSRLLEQALDAAHAPGADPDALTHGFHSYPARMHPTTARRLIAGLLPVRGRLLDPFCGSGTVLVEGCAPAPPPWDAT